MARPHRFGILIICFVLLAGCSALGTADTNTTSPEPSDTQISTAPAQSNTQTSTPTETPETRDLPPGIISGDVSGPFTLVQAHVEGLQTSYTVTQRYDIRFTNGSLYTSEVATVAVAEDESNYQVETTVRGSRPRFLGADNGTRKNVIYSDGSAVFRRTEYEGATQYVGPYNENERVPPGAAYRGTPRNEERIPVLFGQISNVSVTRQSDDSYRIRGTPSGDSVEVSGVQVSNVTVGEFTAMVTSEGLVREYLLTIRGTVNGQDVLVTEQVRYSAIGSTTVEEAPWYDDAVANTSG